MHVQTRRSWAHTDNEERRAEQRIDLEVAACNAPLDTSWVDGWQWTGTCQMHTLIIYLNRLKNNIFSLGGTIYIADVNTETVDADE
jgi:hypothetical protein